MSERTFDVVVIGAGPAGEVVAGRCAEGGLDVALVEERLVGGECSFWGCMPSKALLRPAEALAEARRIPGAAEALSGALDVQAVLDRRDEVIHDLDDSVQLPWVEEKGITLIREHGHLSAERTVHAGGDILTARKAVVVATGTSALVPPIPGLRELDPWTNHEATTAKAIPGRLVILGGGPIGAEMAQAYASLGAEVTLVEALDRILSREEEYASEEVTTALEALGVRVLTGGKATSARRDPDGDVVLEIEGAGEVRGDEVLVAIGRRQLVDDLGLESVGVEADGPLTVGEDLRVEGHDWLYAIGDVNGRTLLTHMGKYQGRLAADRILGRDGDLALRSDGPLSPRVTFTDPQVAAVGHTLASAEKAGLNVRAVDVQTSGNAGGSFVGRDAPGTARIVVDEDRGVLVGMTITGSEVAETIHAATIAVVAELPLTTLWHAVPVFPTRSELWLRLLEKYGL